jgi:enoyl-CoA hydratase/carnithine racemase
MKLARYRLSRHQVERAVLEAGLYDPRTALALGYVDEVAADPLARARTLIDTVAAHPRPIYTASKQTLRERAVALDEADRRRFRDVVLPRWTARPSRRRSWRPEAVTSR